MTTTPPPGAPYVLDLFAGPGGWDVAAAELDLHPIGIEIDPVACQTRHAAGHLTVQTSVADLPTGPFVGHVAGIIGSPPCPTFSVAGKGEGRGEIDRLADFVHRWVDEGWTDPDAFHAWSDDRTPLVLQPLRYLDTGPDWLVLEQVPAVLPIWEMIARALADRGWTSTWAGVLNAADYGVPQTRRRAILIAHRTERRTPPAPTHAENPTPTLFDDALAPWVTMSRALGWPPLDPDDPRDDAPPAGEWILDRPSTTVTGDPRLSPPCHHDHGTQSANAIPSDDVRRWVEERPATTIVGSFRPDLVAPPGWLGDGPRELVSRQKRPGAVKITIEEALVLQSFPPDYPLAGPKFQRFLQVGNAVPPRLAGHVLAAVLGTSWTPTEEISPRG